jgi:hypothetical protein
MPKGSSHVSDVLVPEGAVGFRQLVVEHLGRADPAHWSSHPQGKAELCADTCGHVLPLLVGEAGQHENEVVLVDPEGEVAGVHAVVDHTQALAAEVLAGRFHLRRRHPVEVDPLASVEMAVEVPIAGQVPLERVEYRWAVLPQLGEHLRTLDLQEVVNDIDLACPPDLAEDVSHVGAAHRVSVRRPDVPMLALLEPADLPIDGDLTASTVPRITRHPCCSRDSLIRYTSMFSTPP